MKYQVGNTEKFFAMKNPDIVTADKNLLTFNTGIWGSSRDNGMPQYCVDLQSYSSTHSNMLNLKKSLLIGNNLEITDTNEPNAKELEVFMNHRNKSGDNLKAVYTKAAISMSIFEAACLQVTYNRNGEITDIYHVPTEDVRMETPNDYGMVENFYISKNWANISNKSYKKVTVKNSAVQVRSFDPELWKDYPVQLLYIKKYSPAMYYAIPSYLSATAWILIENEIANFELNTIRNSFMVSGMLTQQGSPSDKEQVEFVDKFQELYLGSGKPNEQKKSMIFSWVDDMASQKPEFTPFQGNNNADSYNNLIEKAQTAIISAHNGYTGLVLEDKGSNISGDSNKLFTQISTFIQYVSAPLKDILLGGFDRILDVNKFPTLTVVTEPPKLTQPTAEPDDLTQDERRELVYGLPPMEKEDKNIKEEEIPEQ